MKMPNVSRNLLQKRSTFEFDGEKYRTASKHQKEWGSRIISELKLNGHEHVLDLGCGDGVLTAQLAELVPYGWVLGIDASQSMIGAAMKLKSPNLMFRLMDIMGIDFANEFDLVFSNATLHWVKDHRGLLKSCYSALKPKGTIRFNFAGDGNCSYLFKVVNEVMRSERYDKYFHNFDWPWFMPTIDEYRNLLKETEFIGMRVWEENADRYFANEGEIVKWIEQPSIVPFLRSITDEKDKREFRDIIVARMLQETRRHNGTFFETFRRINVIANKD